MAVRSERVWGKQRKDRGRVDIGNDGPTEDAAMRRSPPAAPKARRTRSAGAVRCAAIWSQRSGVATAALLLVFGAGCLGGGTSSSGGSTVGAPTRAQFQQRAVAICQRYQHRIGALKTATDLAHLAAQGRRAVALERVELRELRALQPPAADRAAVGRMLGSLEQSIGTGAKLVAAAQSGDVAGVTADAELLKSQLAETGVLARPFGLDVCAK